MLNTSKPSVSVVVPAQDEAGTIAKLVRDLPAMGSRTEIVFVEGFSKDDTWAEILKLKSNKKFTIKAFKYEKNKGKAFAVDYGIKKASGDIIIILDSDITVKPADMPRFYDLLASGKYQFANGSRFVYPKQAGAMRYINNTGNIIFSKIFSLIIGTKITDTLCGSKAFFRKDYARIIKITKDFSTHDPYGDFTLFLGAYLLKLKIKEVPVKYYARIYGKTKISRFRDGFKLLKVLLYAFSQLVS